MENTTGHSVVLNECFRPGSPGAMTVTTMAVRRWARPRLFDGPQGAGSDRAELDRCGCLLSHL